jgi:proteasome assembly chaperone (PAC2) family protein
VTGSITPEHVLFIPGMLLIGMTLGYVMGVRAARAEIEKKKSRMKR